jgi:O-antigen ligase
MTFSLKTKVDFHTRLSQLAGKYWLVWLRWGFVLVVPIIAAGLGLVAVKRSPKYALVAAALPFALTGIEIILRNFQYSPIVILITACFIPLSLPTGTLSRLVFSLVLTIGFSTLWVLRMLIVEKRFRLYPSPINVPLLGFIVVTLISLIWSNLFRDPMVVIWHSFPLVQIASTIVMIMLPMAFLLTANTISKAQTLTILVSVMLLAGFLGLFRQYGHIRLPVDVNGLYSMWVISLATGLALFNKRLSHWQRGLLLALAGVWVYWGFGLHISWLAGWLPCVMVVGIITYMRSKRWGIILVIAMLLYVYINSNYFFGSVFQSEKQESGVTRLAAWELNWRITSQHLLFGTGPGGYAAYYMSYFPTEAMATHSNYLDIIAQTGMTGFVLCIWFFLSLAWYGYQVISRLKGRGDFYEGLANASFAGTIGCIVMMGFGDWLFPFAYTQTIAGFDYAVYNWIFIGVILVVDRLTKENADAHA